MLASAERVGTLPGLVRTTEAIPIDQTLIDLGIFEVMGKILNEHRRRYPNDQKAKVEGLYQVHLPLRFLDSAVGLGVKTIGSLLPPKLSSHPTFRRIIEEWQTAGRVAGAVFCFDQTEVTNRFLPPLVSEAAVAVLPDPNSKLGVDVRYTYGLNWNSLNQMSKRATSLHPLVTYPDWGDIERGIRYAANLAIPRTGLISANQTVIGSSRWQLTPVSP